MRGVRKGVRGEARVKGIACTINPRDFARTPFVHEREAMEHFDWLIAHHSKVMTDLCQK